MALIKCPKCGEEIIDRGKICPHCKFWLDKDFLAAKKQELIDEGIRQYQQTDEYKKAEQEKERLAKLPYCPICGTKDHVRRIGTLKRSMSVMAWGLASSKIGKQYECTNCKHKW